jgi:monofunctional biosynthetic peptidoglycan transglycosylase
MIVLRAADTDLARDWRIVNDGVMGGVSTGGLAATPESTIVFSGTVSLENRGGFASVRLRIDGTDLSAAHGLELRVKGDGRIYRLLLRTDDRPDGIVYRAGLPTRDAEWTTPRIAFADCVPSFRGRAIPGAPPPDPRHLVEVGFLIGDQQEGPFRLEIDTVHAF